MVEVVCPFSATKINKMKRSRGLYRIVRIRGHRFLSTSGPPLGQALLVSHAGVCRVLVQMADQFGKGFTLDRRNNIILSIL